MAKVKIQGNASGTGVLTVTAPNTSTDRTITLPDTTGTLLDENSSVPAANLTGTVADARFPATLPAASAANLTAIPAANITGTLPAISGASLTGITGRKNLIINGGFDLWQRGTSLAGANTFLADRWFNTTTETQSRQTFTVGQTDVPHNPTYYHRGTGGSTEWYERRQTIENVAITAGREVTLSYWMKGSSAFTNAPYSTQNFGSGGSSDVATALSTASITTSWARYTHTFTPPSISGKTVNASNYLKLSVLRANVNNITVEMANVQLEFGSVATDFEQRSYGEELALCQRYYEKSYAQGVAPGNASRAGSVGSGGTQGQTATGEIAGGTIQFSVEKRVTPTITFYDSAGTSGKGERLNAGIAWFTNSTMAIPLYSAKYIVFVSTTGNAATGAFAHYTADAEL